MAANAQANLNPGDRRPTFVRIRACFWAIAVVGSLTVALTSERAWAQKGSGARDEEGQRIEAFRADFVRAPDIGLWLRRGGNRDLVVADVAPSGIIRKSGFQENDRILAVDDQRVATEAEFVRYLLAEPTRLRTVKVLIERDGKEQVLAVSPYRLIEELLTADNEPVQQLGILLDARPTDKIIIARVLARSPAFYAGLRPGDEILAFERTPLTGRDDLARSILGYKPEVASLQIQRGDRERYVEIEVPKLVDGRIVRPPLSRDPPSPTKQRTDPGAISPGGDVPRPLKPVPPT